MYIYMHVYMHIHPYVYVYQTCRTFTDSCVHWFLTVLFVHSSAFFIVAQIRSSIANVPVHSPAPHPPTRTE